MTRRLPDHIDGYGPVRPFRARPVDKASKRRAQVPLFDSIDAVVDTLDLRDGATISFHHHLRDGDDVMRAVVDVLAARGLRDLHVAASSIFPVHAPLVPHIRSGVITRISTAYVAGPVARAISAGELRHPAVLQTHGGRARAIATGALPIDVAFVAAPSADRHGNLSGAIGPSACGPLGYAMVDARYARRVVAVTDNLLDDRLASIDIAGNEVDAVVAVPSIGDPTRIVSGTTRITDDPVSLRIAAMAARAIDASGLLVDGFSFQTGAGGTSLAVAADVAAIMRQKGIKGSFAAGGITGMLVEMFHEGLFERLYDVQCFDLAAVASYRTDAAHQAMSASLYADPGRRDAVAGRLDVMILGAAEVDTAFNVNVTAVGGGKIIGGAGGHADTAAGAKLTIITTRLSAKDNPKIVRDVECVTTPGATVDVVVTEAGIAVNPLRADLIARFADAGLRLVTIEELANVACERTGWTSEKFQTSGNKVVAVVEYFDGTVTDVIRQSG